MSSDTNHQSEIFRRLRKLEKEVKQLKDDKQEGRQLVDWLETQTNKTDKHIKRQAQLSELDTLCLCVVTFVVIGLICVRELLPLMS